MTDYPYESIPVEWKRPPIDHETLKRFTKRSDIKGIGHCLGILAIQFASGATAYCLFATGHWVWMAITLYVHGGILAFDPYTHELSHGTLFKRRWLNTFFKQVFVLLHWQSNTALYAMSHRYHHRFTLHRKSEGEEVHPRPEPAENLLARAIMIVDPTALITTLYDRIYSLFTPYLSNPRRSVWQRYVYAESSSSDQREARMMEVSQVLVHLLFAIFAIATGKWFLIVVVTLPAFYGGKWYSMLVHDTMHVGCEPECDDFRRCCRTVRLDPFTSFLYWHMEWHAEHHTYPGIPCYNLKAFHEHTREHWDKPVSLIQAWRDINQHSAKMLAIAS